MTKLPRLLTAALLIVVIAMLSGGIWFYSAQKNQILNEAKDTVVGMTELKVDRISEWMNTRTSHASVIMASRYFNPLAESWVENPQEENDVQNVMTGFTISRESYGYKSALFVNRSGEIYFGLNYDHDNLDSNTIKALYSAFDTQNIKFSEVHYREGENYSCFNLVIPFFSISDTSRTPTGAIIYCYDISSLNLDFWPNPSRSAETMLMRIEGDSALILNELRHDKNSAMNLRIPLDQSNLLSAIAASDESSVVLGEDYRGMKVLSAIKAIPGMDWFLMVKVDEDEIISPLRYNFTIILVAFVLFIVSGFTAISVIWQHREKENYRTLFNAESSLRKNEARFRNILDSMMEGLQVVDFEWKYLYLNATAIRYTGINKKDLLNRKITEIFPGIEETASYIAFNQVMNDRKPRILVNSIESKERGKEWFIFSIQPIPEGIFILSSDITAGKITEEKLRESEARYRSLFENMIQGVFRQNKNGDFIDVNPAALEMFGLSKDEFLNRTCESSEWDIILEDGTPLSSDKFPSTLSINTGKTFNIIAGVMNAKLNNRVWMEMIAIPEFLSGEDKPHQALVTLHDITGRVKMEIENLRLASAIDQSSEIITILDQEGRIQYVNSAFEKITGYQREEVTGRLLPEAVSEFQDDIFYEHYMETIRNGTEWRGRYTSRKKDGTNYTIDETVWPVFDPSGRVINFLSIKRDISEEEKLQEEKEVLQSQLLQAQRLESVGRLAGGIAHDFNNMLNVILGHTQLSLLDIDSSDPLFPRFQEISKAAKRSADLTQQLLAFARRQVISPRILNLNDVVSGLLKMLRRLIGEDIELIWKPEHSLWPVYADPSQTDQILTNLAVNARDAIHRAGRIILETKNITLDETYCQHNPDFTPGEYVMLSLSDTGCGMNKEMQEWIFEPFFTTKDVGKGTGLGLATVFGIVKQNKGYIKVYSEQGLGSTFKIYFPRFAGETKAMEIINRIDTLKKGNETVLLVEDEVTVKDLTKMMLERLGYNVITADTPGEAIKIVKNYSNKIHLMIVDVIMPEMTGRELADLVITMLPELRLLFMSGYTADIIAHHGILNEGVHFIQKPFSLTDMAEKVREVLDL